VRSVFNVALCDDNELYYLLFGIDPVDEEDLEQYEYEEGEKDLELYESIIEEVVECMAKDKLSSDYGDDWWLAWVIYKLRKVVSMRGEYN